MLVPHFLSQFIHLHLQSFHVRPTPIPAAPTQHPPHSACSASSQRRWYCSQTARTADSVIGTRRVATMSCCFDTKTGPQPHGRRHPQPPSRKALRRTSSPSQLAPPKYLHAQPSPHRCRSPAPQKRRSAMSCAASSAFWGVWRVWRLGRRERFGL
jgi:hypothetical protein